MKTLNKDSQAGNATRQLGRKVRVGVLIDSSESAHWVFEMLQRIQKSDYAEIVQVVENLDPDEGSLSGFQRLHHLFSRLGYILFTRIGDRFRNVRDDPFASKSIQPLLDNANWISVKPIRKGFVDRFGKEDLDRLSVDDVDVYLRLGFGILKGEVLSIGRLGIWSYHHGDNRIVRGLPPGFWENYNNEPVTGITLQILSEELDGGKVLYRAFSKTNNVYVYRSISSIFWKSASIIPRVLQKLHRLGFDEFEREVNRSNTEISFYTRPLYTFPSNWQVLIHLMCTVHRFICHKLIQAYYSEQWRLMFRVTTPGNSNRALWQYKEIRPPIDRFWADPFVVTADGVHHVFFEELVYAENRGKIAHLSISPDGDVSQATTVLEQPYHLSYPFMLEYEDDIYMIPESSENLTVDLYRCNKFPNEWQLVKTLIDGIELVDATLIRHDGMWWMFAGQRDDNRVSISDELSIFYTDDLLNGEWNPHPENPVISDVRHARPAGNIFEQNGSLYRPAQDGRHTYGGAVEIRRIDELTTDRYRESYMTRLDPDWRSDLEGLHTLNQADEITVIDILSRRSKLWRLIRAKLRK
jgi:hypothetical protein